MVYKIPIIGEKKSEGVDSLDVTNETSYLLKPPSAESLSIRKERDDPACVAIKRKDIERMQRFYRANSFYIRLEEAGIVAENIYDSRVHNGYRRGIWPDEDKVVALMLFHRDRQILHDLMEEFVSRDLVKTYNWKKLKHYYVN